MSMFVGIEIGGTKLQVVCGDRQGNILARCKARVEKADGAEGIRTQLGKLVPDIIIRETVSGVGVGFGGPVDWRTGRICRSHQIEGWSDFDLGSWLGELTGAPVVVENDANVAALGEALRGAGVGYEPVFYVTLGSGVGGGLVTDGRIYHGAMPGELEIGHVRIDRTGATLESKCSGWAIDARIRSLKKTHPKSRLCQLPASQVGGEAANLLAAVEAGDEAASSILSQLAGDLAFGLSHVVHLCHPQVMVIGGGLSRLGEPLRAAIEQCLREWTMEAFLPGPKVALARLGEDAVPVGASCWRLADKSWTMR